MKFLHLLVFILISTVSSRVISADLNLANNTHEGLIMIEPNFFTMSQQKNSKFENINFNYNFTNNEFQLSSDNEDWIYTQSNLKDNKYSISANKNISFGNEVSFAWNFSDYLKFNLNVFENQIQDNGITSYSNNYSNKSLGGFSNKNLTDVIQSEINRSITGYKFGISSELGLGNNYKLGLNLDYGQLDGADIIGFYNEEISTTSFGLGIRKSNFGASVNTDIFLEENTDLIDGSRFGFEFDWYFSDETKISLGTKQRLNTSNTSETNNSLDSLTGNVQYIKFQHNL